MPVPTAPPPNPEMNALQPTKNPLSTLYRGRDHRSSGKTMSVQTA